VLPDARMTTRKSAGWSRIKMLPGKGFFAA
jgi:hypothetical protein